MPMTRVARSELARSHLMALRAPAALVLAPTHAFVASPANCSAGALAALLASAPCVGRARVFLHAPAAAAEGLSAYMCMHM